MSHSVKVKFRGLCPACAATTDVTVWDGTKALVPTHRQPCVNCGCAMTLTRLRTYPVQQGKHEYVW